MLSLIPLIVWLWLLFAVPVVSNQHHLRDFYFQTVNHLEHRDRHRGNPKLMQICQTMSCLIKFQFLTWSESSLFLLSVLMLCTERSDAPKCPTDSGPFEPRCPKLRGGLIGSSSSSSSSQSEPISESGKSEKREKCLKSIFMFVTQKCQKNQKRNFQRNRLIMQGK